MHEHHADGTGAEARRDEPSLAAALPALYAEVREVAARLLAAESGAMRTDPTSIVHEVYLRWSRCTQLRHLSRPAFFALAATELRRVLVERARRLRRRAALAPIDTVSPETMAAAPDGIHDVDLVDLDEAIGGLERRGDGRAARVVELRYFVGLSVEESAEALGVSPSTVKEEWSFARAFLRDRLQRHA